MCSNIPSTSSIASVDVDSDVGVQVLYVSITDTETDKSDEHHLELSCCSKALSLFELKKYTLEPIYILEVCQNYSYLH